MPVVALVLALGSAATVLLLGEPWREAGDMFTALAGSGAGVAMAAVGFESIKGHGRTSLLYSINAVGFVLGVVSLIALAVPLGLVGVGLSLSITSLVSGALSLVLAGRLIGVTLRAHLQVMVAPLVASAVATVIWWVLERRLIHADGPTQAWACYYSPARQSGVW